LPIGLCIKQKKKPSKALHALVRGATIHAIFRGNFDKESKSHLNRFGARSYFESRTGNWKKNGVKTSVASKRGSIRERGEGRKFRGKHYSGGPNVAKSELEGITSVKRR